jgi:hypothetical protein
MQDFSRFWVMLQSDRYASCRSVPKTKIIIMKKLLLALTAISALALTSAFAGEGKECKKCSGADKNAACCCKEAKSCDKDKAACPKEGKDAKPAPSTEKKN